MWGGGFLWQWGVTDYAGGYVIHVSSGVAGFVTAYWVCLYISLILLMLFKPHAQVYVSELVDL